MMSNNYLVMAISRKRPVNVNSAFGDMEVDIELSWADGMVGCAPVFKDRESAENYAKRDAIILEVKTEE